MHASEPEVAVVVATRNRAGRLEALLRSLAEQDGPAFETIVVDDGSTDATPEVLERSEGVRSLRHETSQGPAVSRNEGWRAARAELVAFVDDDVVADPQFVAALVDAHRRTPGAVLQGRTDFDPDELERATAFWRSMKVQGPDPFFPTCNIAYPRGLLERLGGFDERYRRPAGEDTDLGWRATETGAPVEFVDRARVRHAVHQMGLVALVKDARRLADNVRVARQHPGIRASFHRRVFWHASHERLLLLLAGLALARPTRGLSLGLGLPYALLYGRHHDDPAGAIASLPAYVLMDLAQLAVLARASARYRTLLL